MKTALRLALIVALVVLAGCAPKKPWHGTDVTGTVPKLELRMTRASDGNAVTAEDYRGHVVLLYFGYTHCPDICPTTLSNLADVLHRLGPEANRVQVLFVTVDPDRDGLALLKDYAAAFAPQVEALRGSDSQIAALARRYGAHYTVKKTPVYEVSHSSAVFAFDEHGAARLIEVDTKDTTAVTEDLKRVIAGE